MIKNKNNFYFLIIGIMFFYLCWGIPQFFNKYNFLSTILNKWFFSVIYTGIAGCLIPILLKNNYNIDYSLETTILNKFIGILILILTLVFGLIFSGALINTFKYAYTAIVVLKYILLFFPMALGISLFAFLLIPRFIDRMNLNRVLNLIVTVILTGVFFFAGFFIDSTFGDIELAFTMAFLGIFFGLSNWFIKNFWIAFAGFFITVLFNTLSENKYNDYSLIIVLSSTAISLVIIIIDILRKRRGQNYA